MASECRSECRSSTLGWRLVAAVWFACLPMMAEGAEERQEPSAAQRAEMVRSGFASAALLAEIDTAGVARVLVVYDTVLPGPFGPARMRVAANHPSQSQSRAEQLRIAEAGDRLLGRFASGEFLLRHRLKTLSAMSGEIGARGLARLHRDETVVGVALDAGGRGGLAEALPLGRLDGLNAIGLTGSGVTLAVIDSGIDTDHPDLTGALVSERCFCSDAGGCCPGGGIAETGPGSAEDDHGHGTNVAGILASSGGVAATGGAPDAGLVVVKVLDEHNNFCCISDVMSALEAILVEEPDVDVVNMSLGTFALYAGVCDGVDLATLALGTLATLLREAGVLLVASAMNDGSSTAMAAPACLSSVLSVGAVYDAPLGPQTLFGCTDTTTTTDQIPCWSNSNGTTDLVAPGATITSTGLGGGTSTFRGTSQAAGVVSACAGLLREAEPGLTPLELRTALTTSATSVQDPKNGYTFPRLDCEEALASLGPGECDDSADNDGDANIDHPADPGCDDPADVSENSPTLACDDGLDNDGDGAVDAAQDTGCLSLLSLREDPACSDGIDNDGDGRIDWDGAGVGAADPQCAAPHGEREKRIKRCGLASGLAPLISAMWWRRRRIRSR